MINLSSSRRGFTVLELMVGIVIFTIGFLGAYLLVNSANNVSLRARDELIGANLMREQIELLKNLRDTNWLGFRTWDSLGLAMDPVIPTPTLEDNTYYTIENNFDSNKWIKIKKLPATFNADKTTVLDDIKSIPSLTRLCTDSLNRYTHNCTWDGTQKTPFASFFRIEPLTTRNTVTNTDINVGNAHKIVVYFISTDKGYRVHTMSTIITNWKTQ